jgi:hypothetical protein
VAGDGLEDRKLSLDQGKERRGLSFENDPFVATNPDVGGSRCDRCALGVWDARE